MIDIADPRSEDSPTMSPHKSICDIVNEDFLPARKKDKQGNDNLLSVMFLTLPLVCDGVIGSDHTPTPEEWQKLMCECNQFTYIGFSPLFSYLEPKYVVPLNLSCMYH